MKANEKCHNCEFHQIKGELITEPFLVKGTEQNPIITNTKLDKVKTPHHFCTFRGINLNNIIVKNCSIKDRIDENYKEIQEENNRNVFKKLPSKVDFFR